MSTDEYEILDPEIEKIKEEQAEQSLKDKSDKELTIKQLEQKYGVKRKRVESKAEFCKRLKVEYSNLTGKHGNSVPSIPKGMHLKLTPELRAKFGKLANPDNKSQIERFFDGVQRHLPIALACEYAGISRETLRVWANEVKEDEETGTVRNKELHEVIQYARMIQAENYAHYLERMKTIADGGGERGANGFLYCWLLERKESDFFSQRTKTDNRPTIVIDQRNTEAIETAHKLVEKYESNKVIDGCVKMITDDKITEEK